MKLPSTSGTRSIFALGRRGDPTAIEPLEAMLKTGRVGIGVPHALEDLIDQLKGKSAAQRGASAADQKNGDAAAPSSNNQEVLDRMDHLEHQLTDMNERLRRIKRRCRGQEQLTRDSSLVNGDPRNTSAACNNHRLFR